MLFFSWISSLFFFHSWNSSQLISLKGLVDTLYLISIYEYFLIDSVGREETLAISTLLSLQLDKEDVQKRLIDQIVNDKQVVKESCLLIKWITFKFELLANFFRTIRA